jgi:signal transduction histidine kinase
MSPCRVVIRSGVGSPRGVSRTSPRRRTIRPGTGPILDDVTESERLAGWVRTHRSRADMILVALVLAAFEMPAFDPYRHAGGPWWPLWGLAIAVPLLWRRRLPAGVLVFSLAATAGALVTRTGPDWGGLSLIAILLGPGVALATAAATVGTAMSQRLAILSAAAIVATNVDRSATPDVVAAQLAVVAAAWMTGEAIRARRNQIGLLRDLVTQRGEQAASDERTRIARELHDVIAHQLSVIAVQAGAARLQHDEESPHVERLLIIEDASRQALEDLRRALGVLRSGELAGGVSPQPGLDQLDRLADRLRQAGLPLELTTTGDVSAIPDGIAVSAYRIVQEALTNVLNHAGRVATTVRVACALDEIQLDVRNDPCAGSRAPNPDRGGHGLVGMRERVAAYGGSLRAGALASGGFEVMARIPLR